MDNFNRRTAKPTDGGNSGDVIFYDGTDFTDDFVFGKGVYLSNGVNWIFMTATNSTAPKVFKAILSQSSTNTPTATIIQNTLGEVPSFTYIGVGNYRLSTVASLFDINKTIVMIGQENQGASGFNMAYVDESDDTKIVIQSKTADLNTGQDDKLYYTNIYIEVHP